MVIEVADGNSVHSIRVVTLGGFLLTDKEHRSWVVVVAMRTDPRAEDQSVAALRPPVRFF
jgi:hypothetical protein